MSIIKKFLIFSIMISINIFNAGYAKSESVSSLIGKSDHLYELCRGSSNANIVRSSCSQYTSLMKKINKLGWCWGQKDGNDRDARWHECNPNSARIGDQGIK